MNIEVTITMRNLNAALNMLKFVHIFGTVEQSFHFRHS